MSEFQTKLAAEINKQVLKQRNKIHSNPYMRSYFTDCSWSPTVVQRHGIALHSNVLILPQMVQHGDFAAERELLHPADRFIVNSDGSSIVIHASNVVPSAKVLLTKTLTFSDVVVGILPQILNFNTKRTTESPRYQATVHGLLSDENTLGLVNATLIVVLDTHTGMIFTDHNTSDMTTMGWLYDGTGLKLNVAYGLTLKNLD